MSSRWKSRLGFALGGFVGGIAAATGLISITGHEVWMELGSFLTVPIGVLGGYWVGDSTPVDK